MSETEATRWADKDMKRARLEDDPSGWVYLTRNRDAQLIVDALIDGAPESFNKSELGQYAGVNRKTVDKHLDRLLELGIAQESQVATRSRYRLNEDSDVTKAIMSVDAAVRDARE